MAELTDFPVIFPDTFFEVDIEAAMLTITYSPDVFRVANLPALSQSLKLSDLDWLDETGAEIPGALTGASVILNTTVNPDPAISVASDELTLAFSGGGPNGEFAFRQGNAYAIQLELSHVPLPPALGLFAAALGALGFMVRRGRRA